MDRGSRRRSSARGWWLLIGAVVIFLAGFSVLEKLVREERRPSTPADDPHGLVTPVAPQLRRLDDGAIEIRHDLFRRTTIRLQDAAVGRALFECLERGIEQTFRDGVEGWDREQIRDETERIQDECMSAHGLSVPTPPPPAGAG